MPGFDQILSFVVKFCSGGIIHPLEHISNISMQTDTFPNSVKVARV